MDCGHTVFRAGILVWAALAGRASAPGGSCGPVASLGMVIRRYLVPHDRAHPPQVVVAPSEARGCLRPPPDPRAAARAGSLVPAPQEARCEGSWKIMTKSDL